MKILVVDPNDMLAPPRELLGDYQFVRVKSTEEQYVVNPPVDAVLSSGGPFAAPLLAQMRSCRVIARIGIGVNDIDLDAASRVGILVTNVPDYCIDELSDHVIGFLLAFSRGIFRGA